MKEKVLSLALACTMTVGLAACGGQSAAPSPSAAPTQSAAPEVTQPAAPELSGTMKVVATGDVYGPLFDEFTEDTGVKVEVLSMSSGEVLSKLRAEGGTPLCRPVVRRRYRCLHERQGGRPAGAGHLRCR